MKNPIPLKYRIFKKYNGCVPNKKDSRDITLGDIVMAGVYTPDPNAPTWEVGFDNEIKYGKLKREHQGGSSSCVGQGWSKYAEMLNLIEEKHADDLSAKDIYSQIFLPDWGAYLRDGAKVIVNSGVCEEKLISSYLADGSPPNEEFMRQRPSPLPAGYEENRKTYKSLKYVSLLVSDPMTDADWENARQIIWQYGGFTSGYSGHCMYAVGYGLVDGKRSIKFINSYGENNDRDYIQGEPNRLYDITFLVDLPNPPSKINMLKIIGDRGSGRQYVKGIDNKLCWIFNEALLNDLGSAGVIDKFTVDWQDNLDGMEISDPWAIIKTKN